MAVHPLGEKPVKIRLEAVGGGGEGEDRSCIGDCRGPAGVVQDGDASRRGAVREDDAEAEPLDENGVAIMSEEAGRQSNCLIP